MQSYVIAAENKIRELENEKIELIAKLSQIKTLFVLHEFSIDRGIETTDYADLKNLIISI